MQACERDSKRQRQLRCHITHLRTENNVNGFFSRGDHPQIFLHCSLKNQHSSRKLQRNNRMRGHSTTRFTPSSRQQDSQEQQDGNNFWLHFMQTAERVFPDTNRLTSAAAGNPTFSTSALGCNVSPASSDSTLNFVTALRQGSDSWNLRNPDSQLRNLEDTLERSRSMEYPQ